MPSTYNILCSLTNYIEIILQSIILLMTHQKIANLVLFLFLRKNVAWNILECRYKPHLLILGRNILAIGDKYVNSVVDYVPWRCT